MVIIIICGEYALRSSSHIQMESKIWTFPIGYLYRNNLGFNGSRGKCFREMLKLGVRLPVLKC